MPGICSFSSCFPSCSSSSSSSCAPHRSRGSGCSYSGRPPFHRPIPPRVHAHPEGNLTFHARASFSRIQVDRRRRMHRGSSTSRGWRSGNYGYSPRRPSGSRRCVKLRRSYSAGIRNSRRCASMEKLLGNLSGARVERAKSAAQG
jgi:hypothetical protein